MTIEELAQQGNQIYVDNCIINRAYNIAEIQRSVQRTDYPVFDLGHLLGSARRFSGVSIRHLHREAVHVLGLKKVLERFTAIKSTHEIVLEHEAYLLHIRRAMDYLSGNSVHRKGKKSALLAQAIDCHSRVNQLLQKHSTSHPEAEEVSRFMCENQLYMPSDGRFHKRFSEPEESYSDASLVSHALLDQSPSGVVIATADSDIINLLRNYYKYRQKRKLPFHFPCRDVKIYFPDNLRWFPGLQMDLIYSE